MNLKKICNENVFRKEYYEEITEGCLGIEHCLGTRDFLLCRRVTEVWPVSFWTRDE